MNQIKPQQYCQARASRYVLTKNKTFRDRSLPANNTSLDLLGTIFQYVFNTYNIQTFSVKTVNAGHGTLFL